MNDNAAKRSYKSMGVKKFLKDYKIGDYYFTKLYKAQIPLIQSFFVDNHELYDLVDGVVPDDEAQEEWSRNPHGAINEQKRWLGLWDHTRLIAILEVVPYCPTTDDFFISLVIVDKNYQNKGIGKKLLEASIDLAKYLKCNGYIKILVEEWNTFAHEFWKRRGFEQYNVVPDPYWPDRRDILMRKKINGDESVVKEQKDKVQLTAMPISDPEKNETKDGAIVNKEVNKNDQQK